MSNMATNDAVPVELMSPTIPSSIEDVTETWIESVLHASETISKDTHVQRATIKVLGMEEARSSVVASVDVDYDVSESGARRLFVKLAHSDSQLAGMIFAIQAPQAEIAFYKSIAKDGRFPVGLPRCLFSDINIGQLQYVIVLEAAIGDHYPFSHIPSMDQIRALLAQHARMSATFWQDGSLQAAELPILWNEGFIGAATPAMDHCWRTLHDHMSTVFSPKVMQACDRVVEGVDGVRALVRTIQQFPDWTLSHGDFIPDNIVWPREGHPEDVFTFLDWQVVCRGSPAADLALYVTVE
eukprot:TRINITY_DN1452_c0_g1_i2.p1 TRINITY_DN1452_c0_g1~~TRINITY_DN1452_c0_g1_i2.p1  ORF type:complete len:297 (+),score=51.95 TRINITY_DN1452_c0_g1_i2:80-970(+)